MCAYLLNSNKVKALVRCVGTASVVRNHTRRSKQYIMALAAVTLSVLHVRCSRVYFTLLRYSYLNCIAPTNVIVTLVGDVGSYGIVWDAVGHMGWYS